MPGFFFKMSVENIVNYNVCRNFHCVINCLLVKLEFNMIFCLLYPWFYIAYCRESARKNVFVFYTVGIYSRWSRCPRCGLFFFKLSSFVCKLLRASNWFEILIVSCKIVVGFTVNIFLETENPSVSIFISSLRIGVIEGFSSGRSGKSIFHWMLCRTGGCSISQAKSCLFVIVTVIVTVILKVVHPINFAHNT